MHLLAPVAHKHKVRSYSGIVQLIVQLKQELALYEADVVDENILFYMAERVRFELTSPVTGSPVFKTGAFNHSATSPL